MRFFLGSVRRGRRGTSRVAPLACLAFVVNVVYLALLVYVAYVEKTPRRWPRARPAAWAGRTIARGSAVHTLKAPRAHGLPDSVSPGVKLPPALRSGSRAACSWSSRPGIPALPAGCAPEDRAGDGAVLPLSPGPGFAGLGEYPWPRIAQRAFDDARPVRRGGRGRIRPSSRFEAPGLRSCTARQRADIGVYDRYRFVVTSRRIVYDGRIVRVVLLVHVRYVALLVNVGGVPSVSMMILALARVEMRTVPCSACRDLYGCGNCPSWCSVR